MFKTYKSKLPLQVPLISKTHITSPRWDDRQRERLRERDSSIIIIRHFLSAYTLSSLSQSCVCVYLYSCSLSRTPWLHSDIHTHTSKHCLALSHTIRTLLRKRGRWLHSGHTYTQTPLHCHPPISPSLSPLLTLAS